MNMENSALIGTKGYGNDGLYSMHGKSQLLNFSTIWVFLIIVLNFIPIGKSSIFPIAPINLVFLFVFLYVGFESKHLFGGLNKNVLVILFTYILYNILVAFLHLYKYGESLDIFPIYKTILTLLAFLTIRNSRTYYFLLKAFAGVIFASLTFGILIHYFGEPFASIRMAILGNENEYLLYYGKGDRVVGFDNKIFAFAYPLAALPILLLTLYKLKQRNYLLVLMAITVVGTILSGERATVLFSSIVMLVMMKKWFSVRRAVVLFGVAFVFFVVLEEHFFSINTKAFERVVTQKKEGEYAFRLVRQAAGLRSILKTPLTGSDQDDYNSIFRDWLGGDASSSVHNAYINVGIYGGVIGWLLLWFFGRSVIKLCKIMKFRMAGDYKSAVLYQGTIASFIAVLCVALTHNAGLFNTGEKASVILLGFIISGALLSIPRSPSHNGQHS